MGLTKRIELLRERARLQRELARVDDELADHESIGSGATDVVYTTRGPCPPGWSADKTRRCLRHVPGARRIGGKRGRGVVYTITHADYVRSLAREASVPAPAESGVASIDDWISAGGYRATKRAS